MIKIRFKLTPEAKRALDKYSDPKTIAKFILAKKAEIEAESHLIDVGLMKPTAENFVWRQWIEMAKQAEESHD